jgi:putative transposase
MGQDVNPKIHFPGLFAIKKSCRRAGKRSASRLQRFGGHAIRDEGDYERHVDYLHDNQVKPGQVTKVADWPYSSFNRDVRCGIYNLEWAADDDVRRLEIE